MKSDLGLLADERVTDRMTVAIYAMQARNNKIRNKVGRSELFVFAPITIKPNNPKSHHEGLKLIIIMVLIAAHIWMPSVRVAITNAVRRSGRSRIKSIAMGRNGKRIR